jgi:hypothetical protein
MTISTVTSEALQLKLRELLPSQQGFGTDLSASDTIIPIIDLTEAAEGSSVPQNLQTALNYGGASVFDVAGSTTTILNTPGFFQITSNINFCQSGTAIDAIATLNITDGVTPKALMVNRFPDLIGAVNIPVNIVVFLTAGDSVEIVSNNADVRHTGSTRQIADINGTLVQPVGFTPS